ECGEPPTPANDLLVGRIGAVEVPTQHVEAERDGDVGRERAGKLDQFDLAPVDGGNHRPQDEGEVARLRRALEQAANECGADEGFLPRRRGWLSLGYWLSRDD